MRRRRARVTALALAATVTVAACGSGPDYQYIESDDGHLYGKIPSAWEVEREGAIAYSPALVDLDSIQLAFTRGDDTLPWRAEFGAPGAAGEVPAGVFVAQHIDARLRGEFRLFELLDSQIEQARQRGVDVVDYEREPLRMDGFIGYRIGYRLVDGSSDIEFDEVYMIDDRRSGLYAAWVVCDTACHEEYADEIDEILTTFRLEP